MAFTNEVGHTGDKGHFAGEVKERLSFEILCACHVDCKLVLVTDEVVKLELEKEKCYNLPSCWIFIAIQHLFKALALRRRHYTEWRVNMGNAGVSGDLDAAITSTKCTLLRSSRRDCSWPVKRDQSKI